MIEAYEKAFEGALNEDQGAVLVDIRKLEGTAPTSIDRYNMAIKVAEVQQKLDKQIAIAMGNRIEIVNWIKFAVLRFIYLKLNFLNWNTLTY